MTDNEIRSVQITEVDTEAGTFQGLFAPYGEVIEYKGKKERYERGLFEGADLVDLYYNHGKAAIGGDMPIGEVVEYVDTDNGLGLVGRFFLDTARGAEAYTLTKSGKLNSLSANFVPTQVRTEEGEVTVWERAHLDEVSLVKRPAYPSAKISEVRAESNNATNTEKEEAYASTNMDNEEIKYDDSELRSELDIVKRELAVVRENGVNTSPVGSQFRTAGEFALAWANGDEAARSEIRVYEGAVLADSHTSNDWKNDLLVVINNGRPLVNLFDKGTLTPGRGRFVEAPYVSTVSGDVAEQEAEGDELPRLGVEINSRTWEIKTYGGWSDVSRQAIDMSDVSYLDAILKYQASSYAEQTNKAVKDAIAAATVQTGNSFTLSSATAANFIGAVVEGARKIKTNGVLTTTTDFALASADVFDKMASTVDSAGRPAFVVNGDGVNSVGNLNVRALTLSVAGLPVVLDETLANKSLYVASKGAVQTFENSGAPIRLSDTDIRRLVNEYALYGYLAVAVKDVNGLVKSTIA